MPNVTGTIKNAVSSPMEGVRVVATLMPNDIPGFVGGSDFEITEPAITHTDINGVWTLALVANALVTLPTGSYYKIQEGKRTSYALVPNGAGPYRIEDILTAPTTSGGKWQPWIPVLHTEAAPDFSAGTGARTFGQYKIKDGDEVKADGVIRTTATAFNKGTGNYYFNLPVPCYLDPVMNDGVGGNRHFPIIGTVTIGEGVYHWGGQVHGSRPGANTTPGVGCIAPAFGGVLFYAVGMSGKTLYTGNASSDTGAASPAIMLRPSDLVGPCNIHFNLNYRMG